MKDILLAIFAITGIILSINTAYGLPVMIDCKYESDFAISTNKLEFDAGETFVLNVKTMHDDAKFEVVAINPEGKEVFGETANVDDTGYAQARFHIQDDAQRGTWTVSVTAIPSYKQDVVFIGVGESPRPSLLIKPSLANHEYKTDNASFLVAGEPNSDIQVTILEPYDSKRHIYIATLPSEGKCSFVLDLEQYKPGVYNAEVTDHNDTADAIFTVGLQPSRVAIGIRTSSSEYHLGDRVLVYGDTTPNTELAIDVFDASESIVNRFSVVSDDRGAIDASFYLPESAESGKWKVRATSNPNFDTVEFDVSKRPYSKTDDNRLEKTVIEVDGYPIVLSNPHVTDVMLDWDAADLPSGRILFDDTITDTLEVQIPKSMPRTINLDFGSSLYVTYPKPQYQPILETESDCFYVLSIIVKDSDEIRFGSGSVAAGRVEPVVISNESCKDVYSELLREDTSSMSGISSYDVSPGISESIDKQEFQMYYITNKQVKYSIPYKITNGTVTEMRLDCDAASFIVGIGNYTEGQIDLGIPKNMLNLNSNNQYDRFFVLVDGEEVDYEEIPNSDYRNLVISFPSDTKQIEIIQAWIPEEPKPEVCRITHDPPQSYLLSPLKQFNSDVPVDEIQCKDNLSLIQKYDEMPACVKPESASILYERGWTTGISHEERVAREEGYLATFMVLQVAKPNQPIAMDIEGPYSQIEQIIQDYDVAVMSSKVADDGSFASTYGNMTNANLLKFFEENSMNHFVKRELMMYPLGGYTDDTGTYGPFAQFVTEEQGQKMGQIMQYYKEKRNNMEQVSWDEIMLWVEILTNDNSQPTNTDIEE